MLARARLLFVRNSPSKLGPCRAARAPLLGLCAGRLRAYRNFAARPGLESVEIHSLSTDHDELSAVEKNTPSPALPGKIPSREVTSVNLASRAVTDCLGKAGVERSLISRSELRTDETVYEYVWPTQGRCVTAGLPTDETRHESVETAQDQHVTAFRHTAGKSYPSPEWNGRAARCTCSRTVSCASGERVCSTGEKDPAASVRKRQ